MHAPTFARLFHPCREVGEVAEAACGKGIGLALSRTGEASAGWGNVCRALSGCGVQAAKRPSEGKADAMVAAKDGERAGVYLCRNAPTFSARRLLVYTKPSLLHRRGAPPQLRALLIAVCLSAEWSRSAAA